MIDKICIHYGVCERREYCKDEYCEDYMPKRPQGEWIARNNNNPHCSYFQCSVCGIKKKYTHNFCPICGADMRGEK